MQLTYNTDYMQLSHSDCMQLIHSDCMQLSHSVVPQVPGSARRGQRKRVKPLEFWNNEMPIYTAEGSLEQVQQVESLDPSPLLKVRSVWLPSVAYSGV